MIKIEEKTVLMKWILVIFTICSFSTMSSAKEIIRISTFDASPYVSEKSNHYGFVAHIVSEAFRLKGIKVKYGFFPPARALDLAKHCDWDGSILWVHSTEREKVFYYSEQLAEGVLVFFHLKSYSFDWNVIDDLKNISIGIVHGNSYGKEFNNAVKTGKLLFERVPGETINFRKLLKGRIKLFLVNRDHGYYQLRRKFKTKQVQLIKHHPKALKVSKYHLVLSKKVKENKQLLQLFNQGLKELRKSGKFNQYFEKFQKGDYFKAPK